MAIGIAPAAMRFALSTLPFAPSSQLPAGGRNILAFTAANDDRIIFIKQNFKKCLGHRFRRPFEITAFMPVKRNEIDFAPNRLQQFGKASGVVFGVIDAIDQNIFESNSAARGQRVLPTGFQ